MFKIGDTVVVVNPEPGEDYSIGDIGTVVNVTNTNHLWADVRLDGYEYEMGLKCHTMYFKEIEKVQLIEKPNTFKVGDKVKFKKSSLDSGMIDSDESGYYKVIAVDTEHHWVKIYQNGWPVMYHPNHFEHVKEETMNTNEEQVINWEVGQEVWCLLRGKGVVVEIGHNDPYPIEVQFNEDFEYYTKDGKFFDYHSNRTLFFSEPKIEAELFPPKKPFVPTLKRGDKVVLTDSITDYIAEIVREEESDLYYKTEDGVVTFVKKSAVKVHKLGEEIKFS